MRISQFKQPPSFIIIISDDSIKREAMGLLVSKFVTRRIVKIRQPLRLVCSYRHIGRVKIGRKQCFIKSTVHADEYINNSSRE